MATKRVASINLGDLMKQVPKNQMAQFKKFTELSAKYQSRVDSRPENLPKVDWEYFRTNVRKDVVPIVDLFCSRYEELRKVFETRYELLDLSKYYTELDEQKKEVEKSVVEYIKQSNERIKQYEAEIERIKKRIPYDEMTMEEFCELVPEKNPLLPCCGRNTFWPFLPDEQTPGPAADVQSHDDEHDQPKLKQAAGSKLATDVPAQKAQAEAKKTAEGKDVKKVEGKLDPVMASQFENEKKAKGEKQGKEGKKDDPKK